MSLLEGLLLAAILLAMTAIVVSIHNAHGDEP